MTSPNPRHFISNPSRHRPDGARTLTPAHRRTHARGMRAVVVVVGGVVSYPQAQRSSAKVSRRSKPDGQGGIVLRVLLNGRGPFRFLLDTGSTHTAVSGEDSRGDRRSCRCEDRHGLGRGQPRDAGRPHRRIGSRADHRARPAGVGRGARGHCRRVTVSSVTMRSRRSATRSTSASGASCGGRSTRR